MLVRASRAAEVQHRLVRTAWRENRRITSFFMKILWKKEDFTKNLKKKIIWLKTHWIYVSDNLKFCDLRDFIIHPHLTYSFVKRHGGRSHIFFSFFLLALFDFYCIIIEFVYNGLSDCSTVILVLKGEKNRSNPNWELNLNQLIFFDFFRFFFS